MAAVVGCRVMGIDHSRKLIDLAKENRRTSRLGDRVTLTCCPAEHYEMGDENVFFFFNPFSGKVFESVLRRLSGRGGTVICYYPSDEYMACLHAKNGMKQIDDIDCNDLFSRRNQRERMTVFRGFVEP